MARIKITDLLPWWVRPWHWARTWRDDCQDSYRVVDEQTATIRVLTSKNENLLNQMTVAARKTTPGAHVLGYEQAGGVLPEFVLVGIDRGVAGGKRLYASRELGGPAFGLVGDGFGSVYQLTTKMGNLLVIDKPSYGEAMDWMGQIWRNWQAPPEQPWPWPQPRPRTYGPIERTTAMRNAAADGEGTFPAGWTDIGTTEDGIRLAMKPLPTAPGVSTPSGNADEVDGQEAERDEDDAEQRGHADGDVGQQREHSADSAGESSQDSEHKG